MKKERQNLMSLSLRLFPHKVNVELVILSNIFCFMWNKERFGMIKVIKILGIRLENLPID